MRIAVHLGFHCTEEDRLVRALMRNAQQLAARGVHVPAPKTYRPVLKEAQAARRGGAGLPPDLAARLADALAPRAARRLVLSHPNLVCFPGRVITAGGLYAMAGQRIAGLARLLGDRPCELHFALRNPATLIPALIDLLPGTEYAGLMCGLTPAQLSWARVVARIRAEAPDLPLVVWCDEDLPLIWPEVLRRLAGVPPDTPLDGDTDMLDSLLTPVGIATYAAYNRVQGPMSMRDRRRLTTALLERYARPGQMEVDLDLPGWTAALVEEITDGYHGDVLQIARTQGVEFLAP